MLAWLSVWSKVQLMPLPLTVSCFSKIQIGFTFLVPAHPGTPGQRAVKPVCVCVCYLLARFGDLRPDRHQGVGGAVLRGRAEARHPVAGVPGRRARRRRVAAVAVEAPGGGRRRRRATVGRRR